MIIHRKIIITNNYVDNEVKYVFNEKIPKYALDTLKICQLDLFPNIYNVYYTYY
jgi:hypothetical protein